ncbi:MAG: gamma-glutamyltransferase family protein [Gammaproteobacteria bacterium]|nr:gamma-glutamyltransferase family protein [Gammaproteobacteria bacterium]MDE0225376.1 gamma-glutamyltransferase family protein [Gammaproteobacteria bacterium]MDE0450308.1 gamma-glutamyltransferase family protein [Gammaproteobacteria bacterium]
MLNWEFPYASRRAPVFARNVVATSQPLAAAAGIETMRRGGNAIDAALAAATTLTVVEPTMNGLGSDAFAIVWDGEALHGVNGSGRSPRAWNAERFSGLTEMPTLGWDAVTVPGAVDAWSALSKRFGSLPFPALFESAIHYAREGFQVGHITADTWRAAVETYRGFDGFMDHFAPNGAGPQPGELVRRPAIARSLEQIAESHGEAFYRGALARAIVANSEAMGGAMSMEDLAEHGTEWVTPGAQAYRRVTLHEIPPNGQGLAAQIALATLAHWDLRGLPPNGVESVHLQVEAMKIAIRAAFDHFSDPESMAVAPEALLDPVSIERVAGTIGQDASKLPPARLPVSQDTVYLTAADADGRMVSFIQSNYRGFGSGIVVPGTGIAMQNRGNGFTLEPGHPNQVAGGKRPYHTIIPGFVTENGAPRMSFGVMGGHMQHQGHVQMVHRIFDLGENPQAASDAPRWQVLPDYTVALEEGFSNRVAAGLADRRHNVLRVEPDAHLFGGAQLIYRLDDGYCAASDHRKEGLATGF